MKFNKIKLFSIFVIMLCALNLVKTDSVCDLETFLLEVKQDLKDNGMLDCLRVIEPPNNVVETEDQKNMRIAAQWDTTCAFEADNDWMRLIKDHYKISGLVDSIGEPVMKQFADQADLCEILRAGIAKNLFGPGINMQQIPESILDKVQCAGSGAKNGPQICAATGSSYFQKDSWSIFLKSSVIKVGSKPLFVKERPKTHYGKFTGSADKVVNDLIKMGKKGLKDNEAKLASIIDNLSKNGQKINKKALNAKLTQKQVHVHVKRISAAVLKADERNYQIVDGGLNFRLDQTKLLFVFFVASWKLNEANSMKMKINFSGREMLETRQVISDNQIGSLSSAFCETYTQINKPVNLNLYYKTPVSGKITDEGEDNYTIGAISMPAGDVFKHDNTQALLIKKSKDWEKLPGLELHVNVHSEKKAFYYMIIYNISLKLEAKYNFGSQLLIDNKPISETAQISGKVTEVGNHSAHIIKLKKGSHKVDAQYIFDGDDFTFNNSQDKSYSQHLSAFQLPEGTKIQRSQAQKPVKLLTKGEWKSFGTKMTVHIDKQTTVLVKFSFNVLLNGESLSVRLKMNKSYHKKSLMSSKGLHYGKGTGYAIYVFKKGTYKFDLEFKSMCQLTFNVEPRSLNQHVNMDVVQFDE